MRQYYLDLLIDALLDQGFTLGEAERLIALQERVEREINDETQRRAFVRWLVDHQKLNEFPSAS